MKWLSFWPHEASAYAVKIVYKDDSAPPDVRLVLVDTTMSSAGPPPKASP